MSFEEINGIVWNLNTKTNLGGKIIECYGGDYFLDKNFREFWIGYSSGSIILQIDYQTNTNPWDVSFFTNDFGRMVNNDFYKTLFL
ncbi:MAG: hypothetical protein Q8K70_01170 [Bacteroidota bacterium]|nr:hypothetical protein [Bacteroidota bacterium]